MPTRLAEPSAALLTLPGCHAAAPCRPPQQAGRGTARARSPALAPVPPRLAELSAAPPVLPGYRAASSRGPRHRPCALDPLCFCSTTVPTLPLALSHACSAPARSLWWRAAAPAGHLVLEEERMIAKEREEQAGVELVRFGIMVTAQRRRRDKGQFGILLFSFIFIVFHYYS